MMRFNYRCFPRAAVEDYFAIIDPEKTPDAYLSRESFHEQIDDSINRGYRWIRSDGETAVFEKQITEPKF